MSHVYEVNNTAQVMHAAYSGKRQSDAAGGSVLWRWEDWQSLLVLSSLSSTNTTIRL